MWRLEEAGQRRLEVEILNENLGFKKFNLLSLNINFITLL